MIGWIVWTIVAFAILGLLKLLSDALDYKAFAEAGFSKAYYKKEYLVTKSEHQFFSILEEILADKYYVFPQIHLDSLLEVKESEIYKRNYRNKIDRKSVDFVICDKTYLKPLLAIELDDHSHYRHDRQDRDQFVNQALESVGLKCLHIKAAYNYDIPSLRNQIMGSLV